MSESEEIAAWITGRLPAEWTHTTPAVSVDREEITVQVRLDEVDLAEDASTQARAEAAAGRISGWREDTRAQRMAIADEAERRFGRKVAWGATAGEQEELFTRLAVPTMTRLRQPERQVLDTLVEAGVARSRSHALAWCVKLVGDHEDSWLAELRDAMEQVRAVRGQGPG